MVYLLCATCAQASATDSYAAINQLRAGAKACGDQHGLGPLTARRELESVAAAVAGGAQLKTSVEKSGYRASHSTYIDIRGGSQEQRLLLLRKKYCAQLVDARIRDVGVHESASQLLIVLAAPFDPHVSGKPEQVMRRLLDLVNQARAVPRSCGGRRYAAARALRWNERLALAARTHADNMARLDFFSHSGRDGSTPPQRVAAAGYRYRVAGENIAGGQDTPEEAVAGWVKSPGHCANLMNSAFSEMGAAYAVSKSSQFGIYWVQELGAPR
jgi:uncharacterized protein YkwD